MPVTTTSASGAEYTMNNDAAARIDSQLERMKSTAQSLLDRNVEFVGAESDLGKQVYHLAEDFSVMNSNYYTTNTAGMSGDAHRMALSGGMHMHAFSDDAHAGAMNVSDVHQMASHLDDVMPEARAHLPPADETTSRPTGASGGAGGTEMGDLGEVEDLLSEAGSASSVDEKADKLGDAIDALIAALKGEAPSDSASAADRIADSVDAISDAVGGEGAGGGGAGGTGGAGGGEAPAPEPVIEDRTYEGDDLESALDAGGKALNNDDGVIGVKGGKQKDELDGDETLTFYPPEGVGHGATIEVSKLYSGSTGKDKIQERGYVEVHRPDGSVEKVEFRGNGSGEVTVEIEGEFTKLEFHAGPDAEKGGLFGNSSKYSSDYGIRSITVGEEQEAAAPAPGEEGPGGSAPGEGAPGSGEGGSRDITIDPALLVDLIESLGSLVDAIQASDLSPAEKEKAIDDIMGLVETLTAAMGEDSDGGQEITGAELASALGDLKDVLPAAEALGEEGGTHLDHIADGLEAIVAGLPTAEDDEAEA